MKFVKSNAIVYARDGATLGIGAGQPSRVMSARIARAQGRRGGAAARRAPRWPRTRSSRFATASTPPPSTASRAIVQPGGSMRDEEVVRAADEHGMAMVFTGMRHFRH